MNKYKVTYELVNINTQEVVGSYDITRFMTNKEFLRWDIAVSLCPNWVDTFEAGSTYKWVIADIVAVD